VSVNKVTDTDWDKILHS